MRTSSGFEGIFAKSRSVRSMASKLSPAAAKNGAPAMCGVAPGAAK